MEESKAKLSYIQDLHHAYEKWLSVGNFQTQTLTTAGGAGGAGKPKLEIVDANLDEEKIMQLIHAILKEKKLVD